MGLNHLQSLICTYSADDWRPLMRGAKSEEQRFECSWRIRVLSLFYACGKMIEIFLRCSIIFLFLIIVARVNLQHQTLHDVRALVGRSGAAYDPSYIIGL